VTAAPFYDAGQLAVWLETFTEDRMRHFADEAEGFVDVAASNISGFAGLVVRGDGDGELEFLHVRPEFAGRGVARQLIEAVEDAARQRSLNNLWADASLLVRPVLEHLGYSVIEVYLKAVRGATFDNAWLRKSLV
jgi:ribosomal protein S18 acetylase RimI-like enzyme